MLQSIKRTNIQTSIKSKSKLFGIAAALIFAMTPMAHANSDVIASGLALSGEGHIVAGSLLTSAGSVMALGTASEMVITGIKHAGESTVVTVKHASEAGVEASFAISSATAKALGLAVKGVFNLGVITAEGTSKVIGYTLSQSGKVVLYISEGTHKMHATSEKL